MFALDSIQVMNSLIISVISYTLPLGLLQPKDLELLQKEILGFCRPLLGLPNSIAREALLYPRAAGGLEFTDLDSLATACIAATCLASLSDKGRLGRLCRSLVRMQLSRVGDNLDYVASRSHWPRSPWLCRLDRRAHV